mmetsp:Transcript_62138/g.202798  ORF Transcript_62138/g.202798 Transcript_62138/m.202798 type:complete len:261 (+) Transcript_62138:2071-2853(+)
MLQGLGNGAAPGVALDESGHPDVRGDEVLRVLQRPLPLPILHGAPRMSQRGHDASLRKGWCTCDSLLLQGQVCHVEMAHSNLALLAQLVESSQRLAEVPVRQFGQGLWTLRSQEPPLHRNAYREMHPDAQVGERALSSAQSALIQGRGLLAALDRLQPQAVLLLREVVRGGAPGRAFRARTLGCRLVLALGHLDDPARALAPAGGGAVPAAPGPLRPSRVHLGEVQEDPSGVRVVPGEHHPTVGLHQKTLRLPGVGVVSS